MRSHELFEPFLKALSSTQKSAMKIVLWSSVAAFFELCMLAAFIPLIGVITNQPIPDFLAFGLSVDSFINSYSAFLVLFILSAIALRMYAQYSLIAFGYGIAEKVSTQQLTYAPQHKTDQDQSENKQNAFHWIEPKDHVGVGQFSNEEHRWNGEAKRR